jgi:hypothetical protein
VAPRGNSFRKSLVSGASAQGKGSFFQPKKSEKTKKNY